MGRSTSRVRVTAVAVAAIGFSSLFAIPSASAATPKAATVIPATITPHGNPGYGCTNSDPSICVDVITSNDGTYVTEVEGYATTYQGGKAIFTGRLVWTEPGVGTYAWTSNLTFGASPYYGATGAYATHPDVFKTGNWCVEFQEPQPNGTYKYINEACQNVHKS